MIIFKMIYSTQEKGEYIPLERLYLENKLKNSTISTMRIHKIAYTTYIRILSTHHKCKQKNIKACLHKSSA